MSEYQFYEFKSIDKPLSKEDKKEISNWSSRTSASNTGAVFTYSYSDFPKDEVKVVEKYFDAMFYIANWGDTRLILKFPKMLIDAKQIKQYCCEGFEVIEKPGFALVDINLSDEEGYSDWIEGEGCLSSLVSLRDDIISGDYRCLYLIWLKMNTDDVVNEWGNIDSESVEPPIPANLNSLNGALLDFIEIFEIDVDAVKAASMNSLANLTESNEDYSEFILSLSDDKKNEFLKRLLENEALLSVKLRNHLKSFAEPENTNNNGEARTVGELAQAIIELKEKRKKEVKQKREEKKLAKLKKTEQNEAQLWDRINSLIKEKNTKSYDEAVELLKELKELAIYKKQLAGFSERVKIIKQENNSLSGLKGRIDGARLVD